MRSTRTLLLAIATVLASVAAQAQSSEAVARKVSTASPEAGEAFLVTLLPSSLSGYYALEEELGGLVFDGEHNADLADATSSSVRFVQLEPLAFGYRVRVPESARAGDRYTLRGAFWTDPSDRRSVADTEIVVAGSCGAPLCLQNGRFGVSIEAFDHGEPRQSFEGQFGPALGDASYVAAFFDEDNKEQLGKVLDGCALNGHYWFFMASTTDVELTTSVTDSVSGLTKHYHNADSQRAPAVTDTSAFECDAAPGSLAGVERTVELADTGFRIEVTTTNGATTPCVPGPLVSCLRAGRFEVTINAFDHGSPRQQVNGTFGPDLGDESYVASFFELDNKEQLGKVLDGCALNGHYWFFMASTTDVELTTTVRDTATGSVRSYHNPDFQRAPAVTDTAAFACD